MAIELVDQMDITEQHPQRIDQIIFDFNPARKKKDSFVYLNNKNELIY
jgi:hypothetical protein